VRRFMGSEAEAKAASGPTLKATSAFDFLTDPVLPSPTPTQTGIVAAGEVKLPSADTPSAVEKFIIVKGIAAPLHLENVDTDMIIPKQFLKTLKRTGLADALFFPLRKDPKTGESTDFILNRKPYDKSKILVVTGKNFGCGSSREHAPWSLNDFGIRCIIAPSFADIFRNNSMQNGMLPVALSVDDCRDLAKDAEEGLELEVDLEKQEIRRANGKPSKSFVTDPFRRHCLLNGLDDIALTLQNGESITEFEQRRSAVWPWLDGFGYKGKIPSNAAVKVSPRKKTDW